MSDKSRMSDYPQCQSDKSECQKNQKCQVWKKCKKFKNSKS